MSSAASVRKEVRSRKLKGLGTTWVAIRGSSLYVSNTYEEGWISWKGDGIQMDLFSAGLTPNVSNLHQQQYLQLLWVDSRSPVQQFFWSKEPEIFGGLETESKLCFHTLF